MIRLGPLVSSAQIVPKVMKIIIKHTQRVFIILMKQLSILNSFNLSAYCLTTLIFFLVYPEMLKGFVDVNLAGRYTYQVGEDLEINPSFSLTRVILILLDWVNLDVNNLLIFGIIILITLLPLYFFFISSTNKINRLIYGYFSAITITLLVYFDSWPHHVVVLTPFLIFFLLINKNFRLYVFFKYLHYLFAILTVAFWGIFYLTYQIIPFNIGGLILIVLLYYTLLIFYKQRHHESHGL